MTRVAVFVDAGYLYAAGSIALLGINAPRSMIDLNQAEIIAKLRATAAEKANDAQLLRIYWYDGALRRGPSPEQRRVADADDVKLRLGVVTPSGQQKGVDSLIITDLMELARNRAISDAVLLSGDEDVRIGVQRAQSFGVRVHLVGIAPTRKNQSLALMQESDTATEWDSTEIAGVLEIFDAETGKPMVSDEIAEALDSVVAQVIRSLDPEAIRAIASLSRSAKIPSEYDRLLLTMGGERTGSPLGMNRRYYLRSRLKAAARDSAPDTGTDSGSGE